MEITQVPTILWKRGLAFHNLQSDSYCEQTHLNVSPVKKTYETMEAYFFIFRCKTALLFSCLNGVYVKSNDNEKKRLG